LDEVLRFGAVSIHLGEKSGKYPDGNQVIVNGGGLRVAFDTPLCSNRIGSDFDDVDLVILGHAHEDHMAGLHRVPKGRVEVHEADLDAVRSPGPGSANTTATPPDVLAEMKTLIERDFHYVPRPDATGYTHGQRWDLGGGVRIRAHHLPGHTSGHCALVVESEGVAFIGDIDLTGFGPYYGDATSSLAAFRKSLAEVAELDARIWVTSHHRAVITERSKFLADLAGFAGKIDERRKSCSATCARDRTAWPNWSTAPALPAGFQPALRRKRRAQFDPHAPRRTHGRRHGAPHGRRL
jgi:glyoxylase-like metal-dependent hydrolase (beta-lactamase superfamily II)